MNQFESQGRKVFMEHREKINNERNWRNIFQIFPMPLIILAKETQKMVFSNQQVQEYFRGNINFTEVGDLKSKSK
jgi:hypothetical protein